MRVRSCQIGAAGRRDHRNVWRGYREAGMAGARCAEHASGIATVTAVPLDQDQAQAAFELERVARSLLAERMHDGLVQNVAAALLLLATVQPDAASADRYERGIAILRTAFTSGRRDVLGSMEPLDRSLAFTLALLLEGTGAGGSVTAPENRLPRAVELTIFHAVQDALLWTCGPRPVRVRVVVGDSSVVAGVRADLDRLDDLVSALDFRVRMVGGSARALAHGRGVVVRLPLDHSL
jgi:hypothetical protein